MWTASAPSRTFVGDWETPSSVVLVYGDEWLETYEALIESLTEVVDVTVLIEEGQDVVMVEDGLDRLDPDRRARIWSPGHEVDSSWPRDYGPLQVRESSGAVTWLDSLYTLDRPRDDELPGQLADWFGADVRPLEHSLDGGAIASNGRGLCVSTVEYFELADIDATDEPLLQGLMSDLGCEALALVPALELEDTKHVDLVMQFLSPTLVVVARFDPLQAPEDARRADRAVDVLQRTATSMGLPLTIERIDSPPAQGDLYPSYVNFLQIDGYLLVPAYTSVERSIERRALRRLAELVPDKTVLPIPSDEVLPHGGAVHCLTWGMVR
ncbi:agmatine deiminase family protein [Paraliomyxa miuraensis]|uniref:agmatine deiminase family protein n=1 Tax=Paraliomyxa miuraensis TaxID=376150 RepID=UPI0022548445|nr:agmatine deiminase family protein [Paraliomyxa miuraensis]MCX4239892.1 agmatine deiminase family protein [Paraliomyxa miuraensis]